MLRYKKFAPAAFIVLFRFRFFSAPGFLLFNFFSPICFVIFSGVLMHFNSPSLWFFFFIKVKALMAKLWEKPTVNFGCSIKSLRLVGQMLRNETNGTIWVQFEIPCSRYKIVKISSGSVSNLIRIKCWDM